MDRFSIDRTTMVAQDVLNFAPDYNNSLQDCTQKYTDWQALFGKDSNQGSSVAAEFTITGLSSDNADDKPVPMKEPEKKTIVELEKDLEDLRDTFNDAVERKDGKTAEAKAEAIDGIFKELTTRHDAQITDKDFAGMFPSFETLLKALKAGKILKPGTTELSNQQLQDEDLKAYHSAIVGDICTLVNQIRTRECHAEALECMNKKPEAAKVMAERNAKIERLMEPVDVNGQKIKPITMIEEEGRQLRLDADKTTDKKLRAQMLESAEIIERLVAKTVAYNKPKVSSNGK